MWKIVRGLIPLVVIGGAVVIFPDLASASNCAVFSSDGTPLTYTSIPTSGGAGSIQDFGTNEDRVTKLEKTYRVTFECVNNNTVNLSVTLNTLSAPNFASTSAENLDLINTDTTGVTHEVNVVDVTNGKDIVVPDITANSDGTLVVNPATAGANLVLDINDRITFDITSTFLLTGGAEEFAQGSYNSEFRVEVTPDVDTGVSNTTNINGLVDKECSVQTPSLYTQGGGVTPIPYQMTTGIVGNEDRVNQFSASDKIVFDCNSGGFQYSINLDTLNAPDFTNAENIDLVVNPVADKGVNHQVVVNLNFPSGNVLPISTTYSKVTTGGVVTNTYSNIDANGDVEIGLTSRFVTVNTAEELGAGNYRANFTITVTAQ